MIPRKGTNRSASIVRRDIDQLRKAAPRVGGNLVNLARIGFAAMQRRTKSADTMYPHLKAIEPYCQGKKLEDIVEVAEQIVRDGKRRRLSPRTINRRLTMLRNAAKISRRAKITEIDYAAEIKTLPETTDHAVFLTRAQVQELADAMENPECSKATLIAAYSGVPRGQLLRLHKKNVTRSGDLSVPGRPIIRIPPKLKTLVRDLPIRCTDQQLRYAWEQAAAKVGIRARFQDLHHTYASWLIEGGVSDPAELQRILGQRSPLTIKRYAHLFRER